jgi:hypothetical protein
VDEYLVIPPIAPIGGLGFFETISGGVPTDFQYTPRKMVDHSQIQPSIKESYSKLHGRKVTNYIRTIEKCQQRSNDLSVILICFGHVLRQTKPLKKVIYQDYFFV